MMTIKNLLIRRPYGIGTLFFLLISITGCALLNTLPVMGTVDKGVYTQTHNNFSCPLTAPALGLHGNPRITDAARIVKTKDISLWQRKPSDTRRTRIVRGKTVATWLVKFEDQSGSYFEINTHKRMYETDRVLNVGFSGGFSWNFSKREIPRSSGRMVMGLLLIPWHDENDNYMGINAAKGYQQGQGPDARLWIKSNIVIDQTIHTITIKLPLPPLLSAGVHIRDLPAIRDDIASRPDLQDDLIRQASDWLAQCHFPNKTFSKKTK